MATITDFEDLTIWQKAIDLADDIFNLAETGKLEKDYSTKDQLKRAVLSISNNIADGFEYNNNAGFVKFLRYAKGSCGECRSMFALFKKRGWITTDEYIAYRKEFKNLGAQIGSFISYLKTKVKEERAVKRSKLTTRNK